MNHKNKVISSFLTLSLLSNTFSASEKQVEKNKFTSKLAAAHTLTDYLGDSFLILGGLIHSISYIADRHTILDKGHVGMEMKDVRPRAHDTIFVLSSVGIATKLFVSFPLNIIRNIKN